MDTPTLDPRQIYLQAMEARKRKQLSGQNDYMGADIPSMQPPITPTSYQDVLPISGYRGVETDSSFNPNNPYNIPNINVVPTLPTPPPETTTKQAIDMARLPPPPPAETPKLTTPSEDKTDTDKEGFISKLGRGAVAGLTELFKGVGMGPRNYEDHRAYLARLPYERENTETQRKAEATEFDRRLALTRANETPQTQLAQIKLDAQNAYMAGTATPEQMAIINEGEKPMTLSQKTEISQLALFSYTDRSKFSSPEGAIAAFNADSDLIEHFSPAELSIMRTQIQTAWDAVKRGGVRQFLGAEPYGQPPTNIWAK